MSNDRDTTPADAISALQRAERQLQEAEETLGEAVSHALPGAVASNYRERKKNLWRYRNYLLDLRLFLEECEESGVFDEDGHDIDPVTDAWMHAPEDARREYLGEGNSDPVRNDG